MGADRFAAWDYEGRVVEHLDRMIRERNRASAALREIADGRSALASQRIAIDALRELDEPLADEEKP